MRLRQLSMAAAFVLLLTVLVVPTAGADPITYLYTGLELNQTDLDGPVSGATSIIFSMTLDGFLDVSTEYAWQNGVALLSPTPALLSWSITDGANPLTNLDLDPLTDASLFDLTTDPLGQITTWAILVAKSLPDGVIALGSINSPDGIIDATTLSVGASSFESFVDGTPGRWTVVPEPSSIALLILGLGATALATRRRKK